MTLFVLLTPQSQKEANFSVQQCGVINVVSFAKSPDFTWNEMYERFQAWHNADKHSCFLYSYGSPKPGTEIPTVKELLIVGLGYKNTRPFLMVSLLYLACYFHQRKLAGRSNNILWNKLTVTCSSVSNWINDVNYYGRKRKWLSKRVVVDIMRQNTNFFTVKERWPTIEESAQIRIHYT